ncbi:MAG: xanthine dehydrogenase small subunit [Rhizobacter sp.]|nr:xanthine dehydrogenase small subunit [Rhizobacter sp.]
MNTQPIRFFHQGRLVEVSGVHPTRSVLDWLREDAHCTGTKEGCNEGDCGACTVVIGELPEHTDAAAAQAGTVVRGLSLRTVNACIQFLPTLHGKALFTVEDLKTLGSGTASPAANDSAARHPVQRAMVECHGSQCGFCTPGFVMSMFASYEHHLACGTRPSRQQLADDLSGNLCRCTGYRPILDAGQRMFDLPPVRLDTTPVIDALRGMREERTFSYATPNLSHAERRVDHFHAPKTLQALAQLREQQPTAQLLAGSTDIGLWVNKMFRDLGDIIYVGDVDELKAINARDDELYIGAGASLETAWRALAKRFPDLLEVWLRFASVPIRNAGTMGGNVANGSPIGDSAPVLMALDAQIELRKGEQARRMPLADFYTDYMKNHLQPGEFVQGLAVPLAPAGRRVRSYKISKRFDCDISALCTGFALRLDGDTVQDVRLAYGGMAGTVKLAAHAQQALIGQAWDQASVDAAKVALTDDYKPLSDMRASAAYRMQVAQNLLQRFWLETRTDDPLPAQASSVWSVLPHDLDLQGA